MADVISGSSVLVTPGARDGPAARQPPELELIELLFFAYRDFVGVADRVLEQYEFGRAHHRVLHFVSRNPGISVTALLDILKITKQSLGRVLKQLVDAGYIEQRPGPVDRRQRLLYASETGIALARELATRQAERIAEAVGPLGPEGSAAVRLFLSHLVNHEERGEVMAIVSGGSPEIL